MPVRYVGARVESWVDQPGDGVGGVHVSDADAELLETTLAAETYLLDRGDIRHCPYCTSMYGHSPGCRDDDVHPECPFCGNIVGHRSSTCPGRLI